MPPAPPCIDHVILLVRDLEAAAHRFARLGFQSTPRTHHPHGTANRLQMLHGNFLELMAIADPQRLTERVARHRAFLERQEGTFAISFRSGDIAADRARLAGAGLDVDVVRGFQRPVTLPEGTATAAVVETFFLNRPGGDFLLFLCRQHVPEAIWVPQWQEHANVARSITAVDVAVDAGAESADVGPALERMLGAPRYEAAGAMFDTPNGTIRLRTPEQIALDTGVSASAFRRPSVARITVEVGDLDRTRAWLRDEGVRLLAHDHGPDLLRVDPSEAYGLVIDFAAAPGAA